MKLSEKDKAHRRLASLYDEGLLGFPTFAAPFKVLIATNTDRNAPYIATRDSEPRESSSGEGMLVVHSFKSKSGLFPTTE